MDKENVCVNVYTYIHNETFGHKKRGNPDCHDNMDKP